MRELILRPIIPRQVTSLGTLRRIRRLTPSAVKVLRICMSGADDPETRPAALAAAKVVLDKGWGDSLVERANASSAREIPFRELSNSELEAMANRYFQRDPDLAPKDVEAEIVVAPEDF